jgi:hypothetical protein
MLPFGKQQEILNFLSTTNPEELPGTAETLFIESGVARFLMKSRLRGSDSRLLLVDDETAGKMESIFTLSSLIIGRTLDALPQEPHQFQKNTVRQRSWCAAGLVFELFEQLK